MPLGESVQRPRGVGIEHVKVGLYGLLRTLRWITKISILQAEEQMLD